MTTFSHSKSFSLRLVCNAHSYWSVLYGESHTAQDKSTNMVGWDNLGDAWVKCGVQYGLKCKLAFWLDKLQHKVAQHRCIGHTMYQETELNRRACRCEELTIDGASAPINH
jgi:hypothetical protein